MGLSLVQLGQTCQLLGLDERLRLFFTDDDEHGVVGFEGRVRESRQKRGLALRVLLEADRYDAESVVQEAQLRDRATYERRIKGPNPLIVFGRAQNLLNRKAPRPARVRM